MAFHAELSNPLPPGEIRAEGEFGPLDTSKPEETPASGSYTFRTRESGRVSRDRRDALFDRKIRRETESTGSCGHDRHAGLQRVAESAHGAFAHAISRRREWMERRRVAEKREGADGKFDGVGARRNRGQRRTERQDGLADGNRKRREHQGLARAAGAQSSSEDDGDDEISHDRLCAAGAAGLHQAREPARRF